MGKMITDSWRAAKIIGVKHKKVCKAIREVSDPETGFGEDFISETYHRIVPKGRGEGYVMSQDGLGILFRYFDTHK